MVTRAEKLTIWIQFEITRPVAAIKSLRFALLVQVWKLIIHNYSYIFQEPLLLTWINFETYMYKWSHAQLSGKFTNMD